MRNHSSNLFPIRAVLTALLLAWVGRAHPAAVSLLGEQDFADGAIIESNSHWLTVQAGEPTPFSILHVSTGPIQFTHTGLDAGRSGTLTFSLWDLDSRLPGSQITAFSLDGISQSISPFEVGEAENAVRFFYFPIAASFLKDGQLMVSLSIGDPPIGNEVGIDFSSIELSAPSLVPEPATFTLLVFGALGALTRRRRYPVPRHSDSI